MQETSHDNFNDNMRCYDLPLLESYTFDREKGRNMTQSYDKHP